MQEKDILFQFKIINQNIIQKLMKGIDLKNSPSPTQIRIIEYLMEHKDKDVYQKDLEVHLEISRATTSDVLNTMEKKGIIKRISGEDSRTKKVILNKKEMDKHDEAFERLKNIESIITKDISKDDLEVFNKVLNKMKENLDSTAE